MKKLSLLLALTLITSIAILPGCDNEPGENIPSAIPVETTTKPAPEAEPATPEGSATVKATPAKTPAEPATEGSAAVEAAPTAATGPVTYTLAPSDDNMIGFIGYKITGKKQGGWEEYNGTVVVTDGNIETTQINITFTMNSLFSSAKMLTTTLLNDVWFNVEKFPEATFTSTSVKKAEDGKFLVSGDLTMRGVKKAIAFPATIAIDGDTLTTQAEFKVLRSYWEMTDTGLADDLIKDDVVIRFDVTAPKA